MRTAKWLVVLGAVLAGTNGVLFAQPVELPSPVEKVPLPKIEIKNKQPVWCPDGKNIAFLSNKEFEDYRMFRLYLVNPDGTNLRRFPLPKNVYEGYIYEGQDFRWSWSPNGKKIALILNKNKQREVQGGSVGFIATDIYIANSNGTNLQNLTQNEEWRTIASLCWSPDGTKICYQQGYHEIDYQIKIIDANGKFVYKLAERATQPVWSPNGKKIAFIKLGIPLMGSSPQREAIVIMDIDGKNEQAIKIPDAGIFRIYWSRQGQNIFVEKGYCVYSVDTINAKEPNTKEPLEWVPVVNATPSKTVWQSGDPCPPTSEINSTLPPDGKEIAFNQEGDIWKTTIMPPQEGSLFDNQPLNLTKTEKIKEETPCWSPDGKKIVYVRDEEIWVMNSDGTGQTQLTFERTKAIEAAIKKQQEETKAREKEIKEALGKKD